MALIGQLGQWTRRAADLPAVQRPQRILLGDPAHFEILEAINPHMRDASGKLLRTDHARAIEQWTALAETYRSLGLTVEVLPAEDGLVDSCFTANPSLVLSLPGGAREMWLARMAHPSRQGEVALHASFGLASGLGIREMPPEIGRFEGGGDGILHPGRFLLHAGIGPRSERAAWEVIAEAHPRMDVLAYELQDPRFYHLDTALAALDEQTALLVPQAFSAEGWELVTAAFPDSIEVPEEEAERFAGNAFCPDGRHVILEQGCVQTVAALQERGFHVLSVDTGEFRKSGGSVFCLKQAY